MAFYWCTMVFCRFAPVCFPFIITSLLWLTISPAHAVPPCPRSCSCPGGKDVHCTFRHLTAMPNNFPKDTERVNLGYNSLTEVEGSQFRSLRKLEMLMLHGNDISTVQHGAFYSLRSLQMLKLSYNKLTRVTPGLFEGLFGLVRLHLDHNLINFIEPYSFSGLTSLKLLQLEGNILKEIHPHTFITVSLLGNFWTSSLKHLHLSDNLLDQFPASVLNTAPRLELLSLHGNPWTCDCQLHWLLQWSSTHEGVIKCKKERETSTVETCPQCFSPQPLNGTLLIGLTEDQLTCDRPALQSSLKLWDNPVWAESDAEPDLPYTRDLEKPLGDLSFSLSDTHGNNAHVVCDVRHPGDSSPISWTVNTRTAQGLSVNVSLATILECEIDREKLQNLWQLVAYYYESPAVLERGQQRQTNSSRTTYQYFQIANENSPYFTDLKGYLVAEPAWLLQHKVTLKLNRMLTTTKKLVMDFTTVITRHINSQRGQQDNSDLTSSWAMIQRGTAGRVKTALEGSEVHLQCSVVTSHQEVKMEWMLPDLSIVESLSDKVKIDDKGDLVIMNASQSDSGLYHCMIRTKTGVDLMSLRLTVKERMLSPTAFNGQKITVEKGGSIALACEVTSVQPSQTVWYMPKNKVLTPTQKTRNATVMENGTLVVRKLMEEDSGEYSCLASNLYGVDMLSHTVEVTGEKVSHNSKVETETEQQTLKTDEEEGSAVDYQETVWRFVTQVPIIEKPQKNPGKNKIQRKDFNVKKLDPNYWAEVLANANAKLPISQASELPLPDPTTLIVPTSLTNPATTPPSYTIANNFPITTISEFGIEPTALLLETQPKTLVTSPARSTETSHQQVNGITEQNNDVTIIATQVAKGANISFGDRNNKFVPGSPNRRRPPFRRRKPQMRRINHNLKPLRPSSNMLKSTVPPPTITTTPTRVTTTTKDRPTPSLTTVTYYYQAGEDKVKEKSDYKDSGGLDENKESNIETHTVQDFGSKFTKLHSVAEKEAKLPISAEAHTLPNLKAKTKVTSLPTNMNEETEEFGRIKKISQGKRLNILEEQGETGGMNRNIEKVKESENVLVTQSYNIRRNLISTIHTPKSNYHPSLEQTSTSSSKVITSHLNEDKIKEDNIHEENKKVNGAIIKPEIPYVPVVQPIHPWLHQYNQEQEQQKSTQVPQTHKDRYPEKRKEVNLSNRPLPPRIAPTSHWSSNHRPHPAYPPWQGAVPRIVPTQQTRPFPYPRGQNPVATNRPEIIAETVKPTPTHGAQLRDQLLLSRLRNRYRQAYIDRLSQLGKIVTPKPRINYNNPVKSIQPSPIPLNPVRAFLPRPQAPTPSYNLQPPNIVKTTESSLSGFNSTLHSYQPTTTRLQHGGQRPVQAGIGSQHPTALPHYQLVLGAGAGGAKPRITTVNKASMSVLAEGDAFLHCKAAGNPEPRIAWTKLSTGVTIPANTKHGSRFEVFKNGTFVINAVQLQDRGQYLCTAQNMFGSDRMVITLSVQTEAPKIQPPRSTEIAIYLGKSVTLECLSSGKPPADISWILPDGTFVREIGIVRSPLSQILLLENGTLQMQSTNFSSKGDYKCIASNAAGADTITYHLHVAALPPSISETATDTVIIPEGRSIYVHCSMKGEPFPTLKWTLPSGVHVKPSQFLGHRLFVFPNGTLYVKNVSPADAGRYECLAANTVGIAKRTVWLEVRADGSSDIRHPPVPFPPTHHHAVPSRQHSVSAMYGSAVYLHCPESSGYPRGTIWQLPSKTIVEHRYSPERPIKVFRNGTLRILQLTELDGGNYLCVFQRPNGEDVELFRVDVLMTPPRIKHVRTTQPKVNFGENVQVDCVATGLPDPDVSWSLPDGTLINNALQSDDSGYRNRRYVIFGNGTLLLHQMGKKDEGDYTCYAKNKLGKDERKVNVKIGPNAPRISLKSQSVVTVNYGDLAQLSCQATGEPTPRIVWISPRNDVIQMSSDKFDILENGMLVVKRVTLADEGKYACVAQNSAGDDVKNIILEIESREPFINGKKGKSEKHVEGISYQTVLLDCKVEGKPMPKVWWVTPYGHSLQTSYLSGRFQVHQNGSLEVRGVRKTDKGRYMCLAKNHLGEASLVVELDVVPIAEKPSFAVPNIEIISIQQYGKELHLQCPARGKPNPEFIWVLPNGTMLMPGVRLQRFTHHQGNGTLWISQLAAIDKGVYRCLAKNVAGQAEKRYALEAGRKPTIRGPTSGITITYGQTLNLHCTVDGWPQASITWTLPNGFTLDKPQSIGRVTFLANGTLQMRQIATFDKGPYTCKASNAFGSSTLSYPVTVLVHPPRVTSMLPSITSASRGSPVRLNCVATGVPKPEISWTLPGRTTLVPHNRYIVQGGIHMTEDGSLVIQNPVLMNSGIYKCNAKNALGTDFKSTYLQVI